MKFLFFIFFSKNLKTILQTSFLFMLKAKNLTQKQQQTPFSQFQTNKDDTI
jgi:hypothetical protein